jgi:hypothetical protein
MHGREIERRLESVFHSFSPGGELMIWQRATLLTLALAACSSAEAALRHRYSFTSDANDSIGTAHGTVVDAGGPTAVFGGGVLDLSGNGGNSSNGITEDAFVNFPNGIISAAAAGGTPGQLTTEIWARSAENRNWAALFSAGTSNGGEDVASGGNGTDYIQLIPRAGAAGNDLRQTTHRANVGAEGFVDDVAGGDLSTTVERHIVSVYDQSGGLPGNVTMYVDGIVIGTSAIAGNTSPDGFLNLSTMTDNNVWIGRSQWPDPIFDGVINEFRIHDTALLPNQITASFARGPDVIPEPASVALVAIGLAAAAPRRRQSEQV